jgi:hypothetical protein
MSAADPDARTIRQAAHDAVRALLAAAPESPDGSPALREVTVWLGEHGLAAVLDLAVMRYALIRHLPRGGWSRLTTRSTALYRRSTRRTRPNSSRPLRFSRVLSMRPGRHGCPGCRHPAETSAACHLWSSCARSSSATGWSRAQSVEWRYGLRFPGFEALAGLRPKRSGPEGREFRAADYARWQGLPPGSVDLREFLATGPAAAVVVHPMGTEATSPPASSDRTGLRPDRASRAGR